MRAGKKRKKDRNIAPGEVLEEQGRKKKISRGGETKTLHRKASRKRVTASEKRKSCSIVWLVGSASQDPQMTCRRVTGTKHETCRE